MWDGGVLEATADFLIELADGGAALEFGIGTGRVAVPLAATSPATDGADNSLNWDSVGRPGLDPGTLGLKERVRSSVQSSYVHRSS